METCGYIHSDIIVQVHTYYTMHYIMVQEFVHDFDNTKHKFTSGIKELERCPRAVTGNSRKLIEICTVMRDLLKSHPLFKKTRSASDESSLLQTSRSGHTGSRVVRKITQRVSKMNAKWRARQTHVYSSNMT